VTPKEIRELNKHLEAAAAILFKNTPSEKLQDFESLELALRDQLREHVHPTFGHFFSVYMAFDVTLGFRKMKPC
jgi:hypothetical protein